MLSLATTTQVAAAQATRAHTALTQPTTTQLTEIQPTPTLNVTALHDLLSNFFGLYAGTVYQGENFQRLSQPLFERYCNNFKNPFKASISSYKLLVANNSGPKSAICRFYSRANCGGSSHVASGEKSSLIPFDNWFRSYECKIVSPGEEEGIFIYLES